MSQETSQHPTNSAKCRVWIAESLHVATMGLQYNNRRASLPFPSKTTLHFHLGTLTLPWGTVKQTV